MASFIAQLRTERATAILRTQAEAAAAPAMEAAIRGGFKIVEFTLTIPRAFDRIAEFSKKPGIVVGAGTVLNVEDAKTAVKAGAKYLVSPIVDEAVIAAANELDVPILPGAYTPAEMMKAHRAGAPLVKLFPAPPDPPTFIRQVLGPLPFLKIVPTAGVDESNAKAQLDAGAWAVGFVTSLFAPDDVNGSRWDRIEARARRLVAAATGRIA